MKRPQNHPEARNIAVPLVWRGVRFLDNDWHSTRLTMALDLLLKRPDINSPQSVRRHCILHTTISAAPSFVWAMQFGWNSVWQILGMVVGVLLFIVLSEFLHTRALVRSLTTASSGGAVLQFVKVARVFVCLYVLIVFIPFFSWTAEGDLDVVSPSGPGEPLLLIAMFLFMPDMLAGAFANGLTGLIHQPWFSVRPSIYSVTNTVGELVLSPLSLFAQAALATVIEGIILGLALLVCTMVLWVPVRIFRKLRSSGGLA